MLNLPNTIPINEVAILLDRADLEYVRERVADGQIPGICTRKGERRIFKIPRMAFYKMCGWHTDEEIKHAYKMAGLELKEKAAAATATKD